MNALGLYCAVSVFVTEHKDNTSVVMLNKFNRCKKKKKRLKLITQRNLKMKCHLDMGLLLCLTLAPSFLPCRDPASL